MTKPNYKHLLGQIALENNIDNKRQLESQCYLFNEELTQEEKDLFNYCDNGYIEANPGLVGNSIKSYVGTYYTEEGTT
jgi:hypothetical protein